MTWSDRMKDASFRGVPFEVKAHEHEFGRREELHEYPLRATPWSEDLGRAARRYRVDAYVIGPDYDNARDALIKALETVGPGTLVHPYLGTLQVSVARPARLRETTEQGGMAIFSLEFVEAGSDINPGIEVDSQAVAVAQATTLDTSTATDFGTGLQTANFPDHVSQSAASTLTSAIDKIQTAANSLTGSGSALYQLVSQAQAVRSQIMTLVNVPVQLANQVMGIVQTVRTLANTPRDALVALGSIMDFGEDLPPILGATSARDQERANQVRIVALVRQSAASEAVRCVAEIDFTSYQDATGIRDDLADRIDQVALDAGDAGDDDAYLGLQALRLAMIADVTARGGSLARLFSYTPGAVEPALVLAYRLYGDAAREQEIVDRNDIRHPGFVPAGVPLEVLTPETGLG